MSSDEIQKAMLAKIQRITKHELSEHAQWQKIIKQELAGLAKAQQQTRRVISGLTKTGGGLAKTIDEKNPPQA